MLERLRSWAIAFLLCATASAAVVTAAPTVLDGRGAEPPAPDPVAPGLAALDDDELADLLPKRGNFPPGWAVRDVQQAAEYFGYSTTQPSGAGPDFTPPECFAVLAGALTGDIAAVEISGHDPADPAVFSDRRDVRLRIGREYNPAGFDDVIALVSRCPRFDSSPVARPQFGYTVRILEDSRPSEGPQRFRYAVTTQIGVPGRATQSTDYFSYARMSGLILSGSGSDGHQRDFDASFDEALDRIRTAHA